MARKWCGFLPQNLAAKEEWDLLESCEHQARASPKSTDGDGRRQLSSDRDQKWTATVRILKPK